MPEKLKLSQAIRKGMARVKGQCKRSFFQYGNEYEKEGFYACVIGCAWLGLHPDQDHRDRMIEDEVIAAYPQHLQRFAPEGWLSELYYQNDVEGLPLDEIASKLETAGL